MAEDLHLIIKDLNEEKILSAIATLQKSLPEGGELSPYKSVRDLEDQLLTSVEQGLFDLFASICRRWLKVEPPNPEELKKARASDPFRLHGQLFINPKTGFPLTNREWAQIEKDLASAFSQIFAGAPNLMVQIAIGLGKILASMPSPSDRIRTPLSSVMKDASKLPSYLDNQIAFAEKNAGIYITSLTDKAKKSITSAIIDAQRNRKGSGTLAHTLFESFAELNRDWRRIAETESNTNFANGYLMTELDKSKEEKRPIFMIGVSSPKACSFCKSHISGEVVVLVDEPPASGTAMIDGHEYVAIWPGKTNAGLGRSNWTACTPSHPHCKCVWTRFYPNLASQHLKILERAMR